jgi:hypothetical protein
MMRAVLTVALLLGVQMAVAQIKVMTPQWLVRQFKDTRGKIPGSTATFGAPFYGDRVLGRLVYGESRLNKTHCTADDYDLPDPETRTAAGGYQKAKLINIVVVRRGSCSFTTKVKVAYEKGAHAVIIVDKAESTLKRKDISNIIVADDGYGGAIHIPSILVAKEDGEPLIGAASRSTVVVELAWDIPMDSVVTLDLWMSSASHESNMFLKEFASKRRALNQVMSFNPHYAVMSMDGGDPGVFQGLCSDDTGRYCAEDPDGAGDVTGKDVLDEDVRQLCIHENTKAVRANPEDITNSAHAVEYAAKFWDYIEKYLDSCPLEATNPDQRFGLTCSNKIMKSVGIDTAAVADCVARTTEEKLKLERRNQAWSPRALRINGWRYSGMLTADLVSRAVCSGFIHQPEECKTLFKPRDVFKPYVIHEDGGVSFGTMLLWLSLTILLGFGCMLLYKRYLKADMRTTLREEVMLEVQAQMGQYGRLSSGA